MGQNMSHSVFIKSMDPPENRTATVTTSAIDVSDYRGVAFCVHYGASADVLSGSVLWTATLESSATENGTYAAVAAADVQIGTSNSFGLVDSATEDDEVYWLGYNGTNDWVKVVVTATGAHTNGTPIGIFAVLGMPRLDAIDGKVNP